MSHFKMNCMWPLKSQDDCNVIQKALETSKDFDNVLQRMILNAFLTFLFNEL